MITDPHDHQDDEPVNTDERTVTDQTVDRGDGYSGLKRIYCDGIALDERVDTAPEPDEQKIAEVLEDYVDVDERLDAVAAVDELVDQLAEQRALLILGRLMFRIASTLAGKHFGKSPTGKAFCRLFAPVPGRSLQDDAKAIGCTKQNLHFHETEIRKALHFLTIGHPGGE